MRSGQQLLQGLSEFLGDWDPHTTTSDGNAAGTSLVAATLKNVGDNRLAGRIVRLPATPYSQVSVSGNTRGTGTVNVTQPFAAMIASGTAFELHRYSPVQKILALDKARLELMEHVFQIVLDDTTTSDGVGDHYPIPSTVMQGPHIAYQEKPLSTYTVQWNVLTSPLGDSLTGWTATNCTPTIVQRSFADLLIPKYDFACTRLAIAATTHATYKQVIGSMSTNITAAAAAGRKMAFPMWVYSNVADRVTLRFTDDVQTATSSPHQGRGWECLWVEMTVAGSNATTLTVTIDVSSGPAMTIAWNRAWFYFGGKERLIDSVFDMETPIRARRDDTSQQFILDRVPPRGYQIRLQGKAPLSSLGSDVTTQASNNMEVNDETAEVLYAKAAELLLGWDALTSDDVPAVEKRIAEVVARAPSLSRTWRDTTVRPHLSSPFA